MKLFIYPILIAISAASTWAKAQNVTINQAPGWQQCSTLGGDNTARLQCFDQWAAQQASAPAFTPEPAPSPKPAPAPQPAPEPVVITMVAPTAHDCKDPQFSELSRFWELEAGSNCGTFGIRGYKPISLSVIGSNSVNTQPDSVRPDHRASSALAFSTSETRIQLSVRTKIAQGMLTQDQPLKRDSLWFGYTQQSNWQIFSGELSRPFRTTDHEPELIYIFPTDLYLPGNWRLRYTGLSLNHNSNGQPLPLSRSWNRAIVMAGLENGRGVQLLGKLWYRLPENNDSDDNPDISDLVGRGELAGMWSPDLKNTFGLTVRHSLRAKANGSAKLEWLRKLNNTDGSGKPGSLQLHTQLFSGYGDSLIDYNRRRTVLSVGLSLIDW